MISAPADPAAGGGGGTAKRSNQKMKDSKMDELSADVQLFVNVCECVRERAFS